MHVCSYTLATLISPVGFKDSAEHLEMNCIHWYIYIHVYIITHGVDRYTDPSQYAMNNPIIVGFPLKSDSVCICISVVVSHPVYC